MTSTIASFTKCMGTIFPFNAIFDAEASTKVLCAYALGS